MPTPPQNQQITRLSKIASLPLIVRDELNRRMVNGHLSPQLLPWINSLDEVTSILAERFDSAPISAQNISDWRKSGFRDFLKSNERIEQTKNLAGLAADLARSSGGRFTEGTQAILGGRLLEVLESCAGAMDVAALKAMVEIITPIRANEIAQQRVDQNDVKLKQSAESLKLDREKFEVTFCKKLLDAANLARIQAVAAGPGTNEEKIKTLRQVYFSDVDALEASGEVQFPKN